MKTSDTTEKGLESLIATAMTGHSCLAMDDPNMARLPRTAYSGIGWLCGDLQDYDRDHAVDIYQLGEFLKTTQPELAESLDLDRNTPARNKFLARLRGEITKRGTIDILRKGIKHGPLSLELFYGTPSPDNPKAVERNAQNRFSVTRQLHYSRDQAGLALDLALFINGLPVLTFELKNRLTKQTVQDAEEQYRRDRDPRELLFQFGRCMAHFAVDDQEVSFCTHLKGKNSWFLPFNQGYKAGAGNPPNPDGIKTDYLWKHIVTPAGLTNILENYAQIVEEKAPKTGKKKRKQIFPRYHQLEVVRQLLEHAEQHGAGKRYLIQHSAGSGKSNSIAWLAHQLINLKTSGKPTFDSIIVVTDRRILDQQIQATIKQYAQVKATVGHAQRAKNLREFIESGKKIIISTMQKFPFILDEIKGGHRKRRFAIIIDEAHSGQGGKASSALAGALSGGASEEDETFEDKINQIMASRKMLPNASYFAFTATPKNKTLEIFGDSQPQPDGTVKHRPFHSYTMKQAIQERFILDVVQNYTPVDSYYRLVKTVEDDPEFDAKRAKKKLRRYVEGHKHAIRLKAEIMVDHLHDHVLAYKKIDGEARTMVVTDGVQRAIQYFHAINEYLQERKSPYKAIVAFSDEHEYGGEQVTEASLNGFPSNQIAEKIREHPYRLLICADKFQTGYDEPLLHTMYVDKTLSDIKAVQTLSRLNRARPGKYEVFVLDFMNSTDTIREAFSDYYQTTILSEETDPNKLHDLKATLDHYQVYAIGDINQLAERYLSGAGREELDPILDKSVAAYLEQCNEDEQVDFKGKAKAFTRTHEFLASLLPYHNAEWEKLSIFLNFLIPKLPAPVEEDLSRGILNAIDMDSYRVERREAMALCLADEDAEIDPPPVDGGGSRGEPEVDRLSNILEEFNDLFGNIRWADEDRVKQLITEDIPKQVAADPAYQNAQENSDEQNAKIEHKKALGRVMTSILQDDTQLYKEFSGNESFRQWLSGAIFALTYQGKAS